MSDSLSNHSSNEQIAGSTTESVSEPEEQETRKRSRRLLNLQPEFDSSALSDPTSNRLPFHRKRKFTKKAKVTAKAERRKNRMAEAADIARLLQAAGLGRSPLSKFDGKSPVDQFLVLVTTVQREMGLDDAATIKLIREAMSGEAEFFFLQQMQSDDASGKEATLEEWRERLRNRFAKSYAIQLTEMRARKMRKGETAAEYVDAVVRIAKSMTPPVTDEQIVLTLYDNCLPKYKRTLLAMDPQTPDQFKTKLSRLIAASEEEDSVIDRLTDLVVKATTSTAAAAAPKQPEVKTETTLVASGENHFASQSDSRQGFNRDNRGRGGNQWRGGFRGRGNGRGRGFYPQQQNAFYPQQSYGYRPPFYPPQYQGYEQRNWYPQHQNWQQPRYQQYNTFQQRQQYPQSGYRQMHSSAPPHNRQQAYMIESPAATPHPDTQVAEQSQDTAGYSFFPENY